MSEKLYFLSKDNMNGKTLSPRIPENYFTKNGFEDNKTKRVCFAPSIDKALMAISQRMTGLKLYVHIPDENQKLDIKKPTTKDVPDCKITGETWVLNNVKVKCIGKIEVLKDAGEDGLKFTYRDNAAELYRWEWKWLESAVNESVILNDKDFSNNFEKWENNKYPVLLITGLSGGGKTTLAFQLADKYKSEIVELDGLQFNWDNSKNQFLKEFINKNSEYREYLNNHWKDKDGILYREKLIKATKEYIHFCVSFALKNNIKTIIEGIQIYQLMYTKEDLIYMTDKPIIIKGTSPLISKLRQFKRIISGGNGGQTLSSLIQDNNYLKEFRNDIKSTIKESGDNMINEKALTSKQRKNLDDDIFGVPELRKYPLNDKDHVLQAMRFFSKCEDKYKKELARNILKRAEELGMGVNHASEYYRLVKEAGENILNESYVFDDKDLYINFNQWKREKGKNILFVTGLSGSGKTTLGRELAGKNKAILFEIDCLESYKHSTNSNCKKILDDICKEYKDFETVYKTDKQISELNISHSKYIRILHNVLNKVIKIMQEDYNNLYIIEGVQIFQWSMASKVKAKPFVIKGTSMLNSMIRRFKRNGNGKIDWTKELQNEFPQLVDWYIDDADMLGKFKKESIRENTIIHEELFNPSDYIFTKEDLYYNISKFAYGDMYDIDMVDTASEEGRGSLFIIRRPPDNFIKESYEKPYSPEEIKKNYPKIASKLLSDPAHKWRAETGVELIHKEPSIEEQKRIWRNWKQMPDNMKKKSDEKSIELFGIDNKTHNNQIMKSLKESYIEESAIEKKYKCPFCDTRDTKANLVTHVLDDHEDMIPHGYTAARTVYNYINKTDGGHCIYCKGETEWCEDRWKYKRICTKAVCKKKASEQADINMKKKYGKTAQEMLNDPNHQNKMLAGRSISGEYNFKGQKKSYVGTYELKLLEFYDKVLNVGPEEIQTPGPVIEYEFNGKKHQWITDLYYVTANLVHDAKDGGDNPNTRDMKEYRAKQTAKEDAIIKQNKYNYIRLTNNEFEQLLEILAELKQQMMDDDIDEKMIYKINEYMCIGSINPVIGSGACIVNYGVNGQYAGQAFTKDKFMSSIYMIDPTTSKVEKRTAKDIMDNYDFELYAHNDNKDSKNIITQIESAIDEGKEVNHDFFYELLTGNRLLDESQLYNDIRFTKVLDAYSYMNEVCESIKETIRDEYKQYIGENILSLESTYGNPDSIFKIMEDANGYYVQNTINNHRSRYYDDISEIPSELNAILK